MAASSGDDIPTQLAAVLGYTIKRLRITDEVPPRISVIDLAAAITQKDAHQAAEQVAYVKKTPRSRRNFRRLFWAALGLESEFEGSENVVFRPFEFGPNLIL